MSSKRNPDAKDTWQTPGHVVELVRMVAPIALDPCTTKENPVGAQYIRTPHCDPDGLATDWRDRAGDGLVFVNPPYNMSWYRKIESEALRGTQMIALLMAKPGTHYFQDLARLSASVCFFRGRLHFGGSEEPAPFESAAMYFGPRANRFYRAFKPFGWMP